MGNKCCEYFNSFPKSSSNQLPHLISYIKTDLPTTNEPKKKANTEIVEIISVPSEVNQQKTSNKLSQYSKTSIIENYIIVCLVSNEDKDLINYFQEIFNSFRLFTDVDEFREFIIKIKTEKIFIILSDLVAENILSFINKISQLEAIYIISNNQQWINQYDKIQGIFPHPQPICEQLKSIIYDILPIEIVNHSSIIIHYLIKQILLHEINYSDKLKNDFLDFSRKNYHNQLNLIKEFEENYTSSTAIWWYTRKCFTYSTIYQAFQTDNIEQLIKMGFFIRDLQEKMEDKNFDAIILYRGQGILENELELLKHNQNNFFTFKNFLWASIDRNKSLNLARLSGNNPNSFGVLFRIEINSQIQAISLEKLSYYLNSNDEYLLSFYFLFRITDIKEIEEKIWEINLILINDNDNDDLQTIDDLEGDTSWEQLGFYYIQTKQYDKAEELYKILIELNIITNSKQLNLCYQHLANVYYRKNDLNNSLLYYKKCLNTQNDFNLLEIYYHIGLIYHQQKNFNEAMKYFKYALNTSLHLSPLDHFEIANLYHYIADIYDQQGIFVDAIQNYQSALENELNQLPLQYLSIAKTYNKIGEMFYRIEDYTTSFSYFDKTLKIQKKTLSPNHSLLAITNYNIAMALEGLQQYKEAIEYASRAVNIARHSFGSDHKDVQEYEEFLHELRQKTLIGVIPNGSVYE